MTYVVARDKKDEDEPQLEEEGELIFDQVPVKVTCPHCSLQIITFIEHESSWVTYAVSIVLLLVLNWAALCVVPVVYPLFKDVVHHCPRCLSVLATRSRVALPSFKQEVMAFRFGSCAIVLARKYVVALLILTSIIGGFHFMRQTPTPSTGLESLERGEVTPLKWEDFLGDCGFKSYLGNPIHVTVAFNERYKNKTFEWEGSVHHIEGGVSFLWWNQRGAVFVRMQPPQFPSKRDMADLVLLYDEDSKVATGVPKLKRGASFSFVATMVEVGKRGSPHVMFLWQANVTGESGRDPRTAPASGGALAPTAFAAQAANESTADSLAAKTIELAGAVGDLP